MEGSRSRERKKKNEWEERSHAHELSKTFALIQNPRVRKKSIYTQPVKPVKISAY